jgi:hypothetical protein
VSLLPELLCLVALAAAASFPFVPNLGAIVEAVIADNHNQQQQPLPPPPPPQELQQQQRRRKG